MSVRKQKTQLIEMENTIAEPAIRIGASFVGIVFASSLSIFLLYQLFSPQSTTPPSYGLLIGMILIAYAISSGIYIWHTTYRRFHQVKTAMDALALARAEADAANKAKSRFLAKMSHEIRTPMNGVLGMNALLLDSGLTKEQQSYANSVDSSARALLSIIDEILDTSKIEAQEIELRDGWFDPVEVVESLTELLAPRAHAKDIELVCHVSPALPSSIKGDAKRLRQVLINLAGNAIKFTEKGGVTISVELVGAPSQTNENVKMKFSVHDTGIGISKNDQSKIFEHYAQTEEGAHKKYGGTGLGLPISQQIVAQMGGTITVSSTHDKGTTFSFDLRRPVDAATWPPSKEPIQKAIVVYDNQTPTTNVITSYARDYGAMIYKISAPVDLEHLAHKKYLPDDIILECCEEVILDIWLPEIKKQLPNARIWLALQPEHRRYYREILECENIGFLVKPPRRKTLVRQILSSVDCPSVDTAIGDLRQKAKQAKRLPSRKLNVLLAEDNPINARLAIAMLEKSGHSVVHVVNGQDAVAYMTKCIAEQNDISFPDLILMDVFMPKLNGLEATKAIRKLEKTNGKKTPILALTANARKEDQKICSQAGMDGYLSKPFDQDDLAETMDQLMNTQTAA